MRFVRGIASIVLVSGFSAGPFAMPGEGHRAQLERLEQHAHYRDVALVAPLINIASHALAESKPGVAVDAAERAAFILRAEFGVHSFEQFRHDDVLMQGHLLAGDIDAITERLNVRRAALHKAAGAAQDFLELLEADARWQRIIGARQDEAATHFLRARVVQSVVGDDGLQLAPLYRAAGESVLRLFYFEAAKLGSLSRRPNFRGTGLPAEVEAYLRRLVATADDAFEKALAVHAAHPTAVDPSMTAELHSLRGDAALALFRRNTAARHYAAAHALVAPQQKAAAAAPVVPPRLQFVSESPVEIAEILLTHDVDRETVLFVVRVNTQGRATNLQWAEDFDDRHLSIRERRRLRQVARNTVFRPGLNAGRPVAVAGIELTAGELVAQPVRQLDELAAAIPP